MCSIFSKLKRKSFAATRPQHKKQNEIYLKRERWKGEIGKYKEGLREREREGRVLKREIGGTGNAIARLTLKCSTDKGHQKLHEDEDDDVVDTTSVKRQVAVIGSGHQVS